MPDEFATYARGLESPASKAAAVAGNDAADLTDTSRALYVGTGGNLAVILAHNTAPVTLVGVPSGVILPIRVKRIMATNTTASNIVSFS